MKKVVLITLLLFGAFLFALQDTKQPEDDYDYHVALGKLAGKIREKAAKSTVAIFVERSRDPEGDGPKGKDEIQGDYKRRPKGPCTGTIIESDGYIITSRFNVSPEIKKITVYTDDGKKHEAKLLGSDTALDIALLKIDAKDLPTFQRVNQKDVSFGDIVFLLGRAPDPESATVTFGIISAKSRMNNKAYGTDAEMNFGNTGGPLVNIEGKLVGVACNIKPKATWGHSSGVGFAAKIDEIEKMLAKLKKGDKITHKKVPWLGIMPGGEDDEGIRIMEVIGSSPADDAGLKKDDIVTHFDGKKVTSFEELTKLVEEKKIGDKVKVRYCRKVKDDWEQKETDVTLEEKVEG